jgi:hypothetical protein
MFHWCGVSATLLSVKSTKEVLAHKNNSDLLYQDARVTVVKIFSLST